VQIGKWANKFANVQNKFADVQMGKYANQKINKEK
jgi:hypothetical protein